MSAVDLMGARSARAVSGTGQEGSEEQRERKSLLHVKVHHKVSNRLGSEPVSTDLWINGDEAQRLDGTCRVKANEFDLCPLATETIRGRR